MQQFTPGAQLSPYNQGALRPNPEGWAAFGAVLGVMIGGVAGGLLAIPMKPADFVETIAPSPEQAMLQADAQAKAVLERWSQWRLKAHILSGVMATAGSALGAYMGAGPGQKGNAALGAAIGTGAMRTLNVIFNPVIGLPGVVAGAAGAWIGARRAPAFAPGPSPMYSAAV